MAFGRQEITVPKGATFETVQRGREPRPADPQAVKWVTDGNDHYVIAPASDEDKKAWAKDLNELIRAARQQAPDSEGKLLRARTASGVLNGENVIKVWGERYVKEAPKAE